MACEGARNPDAAQRLGLIFTAQSAQGARHDVSIEAVAAVQDPQWAAACQPGAESQHVLTHSVRSGDHQQAAVEETVTGKGTFLVEDNPGRGLKQSFHAIRIARLGAKNNSLWREGRGERGANPLGEAAFFILRSETTKARKGW